MPKDDEIQTVKVEFVTPDRGPKPNPIDVVKQLVDQRVAEIMANEEVWLFQPFLQTRRVSYEMRRMQSVPEQRKWSLYFQKWGCLSCGSKTANHYACGFCTNCYARVAERLKVIVKRSGRRSDTPDFDVRDEIETAQQALADKPKALPEASEKRGRKKP